MFMRFAPGCARAVFALLSEPSLRGEPYTHSGSMQGGCRNLSDWNIQTSFAAPTRIDTAKIHA
eukprot:46763-Amphidinium_carterae.2